MAGGGGSRGSELEHAMIKRDGGGAFESNSGKPGCLGNPT